MKNYISFQSHKQKLLQDPQVRKEYDRLEPEFKLIESIIAKRIEKNISQEELARKIGTKQSAISLLESGRSNPSLNFLAKVAEALEAKLHIEFR